MSVASAPGKMIILGEYAVLEGAPSLVYAVNKRARVSVSRRIGTESQVSAPTLGVPHQPFICTDKKKLRFDPNLSPGIRKRLIFFQGIFEALLTSLNFCPDKEAMSIELLTDAFYDHNLRRKLGFGSSSALTVALTKAIMHAFNIPETDINVFKIALNAHRTAQGKVGSGIDIAASCVGGAVQYQLSGADPDARPLKAWTDLNMAVIWTGKSASTSHMVQSVSALRDKNYPLFKERIGKLSTLSIDGIAAYKAQDINGFLDTINNFNSAMQKLGNDSHTPIISEVHHYLAQLAKEKGAAYKPSGAGGGDIGLLFARSSQELERISQEIQKAGLATISVQLDNLGVAIEHAKED